MKSTHKWKKNDIALCEYINGELATGRILSVNEKDGTANVLLFISGKKIKKISCEEMELELDRLRVPDIIKAIAEEDDKSEVGESTYD